ncbi:MAG: carbohydrate ABC transporter permease [Spirochaetia bacterium]|jgi:ABC-type glycerol-3-phosphate transport system permease component
MGHIVRIDRSTRRLVARQRAFVTLRHIVLAFWCLAALYPVIWTFLNSFRDNNQIYADPFSLPGPIIWKNFARAFQGAHLAITIPNSLIYAALTVVATVFLAAMTAFYLSKFTKTGTMLYTYFIIGIMVPAQALLIPLFVTMRNMGLLNSRLGIIIVYIVTNLSFAIFVLTGFMRKGIPDDLIEAAVIDGCGPIRVFLSIAFPLTRSGIATVGTFVFLGVWNEFLFALVMLANPLLRTLNLSVFMLRGQYSSDQGLMAAGAVVLIAPAILMYALFQEQVVKGLTAGAVKG